MRLMNRQHGLPFSLCTRPFIRSIISDAQARKAEAAREGPAKKRMKLVSSASVAVLLLLLCRFSQDAVQAM